MNEVRGNLRYVRKERFDSSEVREFMIWAGGLYDRAHLLLTDSIILDLRFLLDLDVKVAVQRILNPHQLQRVLMTSDNYPVFILARSEIVASWPWEVVESLGDILRIKAYSLECLIFFFVFGPAWVYESEFAGLPGIGFLRGA